MSFDTSTNEEKEILMKKMLERGFDYIQCLKHLHLRGASDVIREAKELSAKAKLQGISFKELCEFALSKELGDDEFTELLDMMKTDIIMMGYKGDLT